MTRARANLLLLIAAATWGLAFYFQKTAMDHIGPVLMTAARATLAAICLAPVAWIEGRRSGTPWTPALTRYGVAAGVLFVCGGILHQAGFQTASVTNGGFLTSLYVIVTPFLSLLILRRKPPVYVWPALVLALAGVWLLAGGTFDGFTVGDGYIVMSAFFWGAMMLVTGIASERGRPLAFTAVQFAVGAVIAVPLAFIFETVDPEAIRAAAPDILYVGIVSSAITFSLFAIALRYTTPSEGVILLSTETLFAAAAGGILLGERLPPIGWAGASLMFAATLLVQLGPAIGRRLRPRAAA